MQIKWFGDKSMKANPDKFQFMVLSSDPLEQQRIDIENDITLLSMVGQSGQKAPKVPRMKSFTLENIRVSKVSCIKRYAYQKFRV